MGNERGLFAKKLILALLLVVGAAAFIYAGRALAAHIPVVTITSPGNGADVSGDLDVSCDYSIGGGNVHSIYLVVDGVEIDSVAVHQKDGSYTFTIDTSLYPNGDLDITVEAYSAAKPSGHFSDDTVAVNVNNTAGDPVVEIASPGDGEAVSGIVTVVVDYEFWNAFERDIILYTGGGEVDREEIDDLAGSVVFDLDTTGYPDGPLEIEAEECPPVGGPQWCRRDVIIVTVANAVCDEDSDCDDGDDYTEDSCENPGAPDAECSNESIECLDDSDCDDADDLTIDKCIDPRTPASSCEHTAIECNDAGNCDDGDPLTIDTCENGGTPTASCTNTAIACNVVSDCDDLDVNTEDECHNPGVSEAWCTNKNIECFEDADCDDEDEYTEDECHGGGTAGAWCTNEHVECLDDIDCDDGDSYTEDTCGNPGQTSASCIHDAIECLGDEDCGDGDPLTIDICTAPATAGAACENTAIECNVATDCDDGDEYSEDKCERGGTLGAGCIHTAIACLADADCDDGDNHTEDVCDNAGLPASFCSHNEIACLDDSECDDGDMLTNDNCSGPGTAAASCSNDPLACNSDSDCGDSNPLTIDTCVNAGTLDSECAHTAIGCNSDSDCGDSNEYTEDTCSNGGTLTASCEHEAITCLSDSDCGDGNPVTTDTCENPGAVESSCMNVACEMECETGGDCADGSELTTDTCVGAGTCDAECSNVECPVACGNDTDCDDGDALTIDACVTPGTCEAECEYTSVEPEPKPAELTLEATSPPDGLMTNNPQIDITGSTTPGAALSINGKNIVINSDATFAVPIHLEEGANDIAIAATLEGNTLTEKINVTLDTVAPAILSSIPEDGSELEASPGAISIRIEDNPGGTGLNAKSALVYIDGTDAAGNFNTGANTYEATSLDIKPGFHLLDISISDKAGNIEQYSISFSVADEYVQSDLSSTILNSSTQTTLFSITSIDGMPVVNGEAASDNPTPVVAGRNAPANSTISIYLQGSDPPVLITNASNDNTTLSATWIDNPGNFADDFNDANVYDTWMPNFQNIQYVEVVPGSGDYSLRGQELLSLSSKPYFSLSDQSFMEVVFFVDSSAASAQMNFFFKGPVEAGIHWSESSSPAIPIGEWVKLRLVLENNEMKAYYGTDASDKDNITLPATPFYTESISIPPGRNFYALVDLNSGGGDITIDNFTTNIGLSPHYFVTAPGLAADGVDYNDSFFAYDGLPFVQFLPSFDKLSELPGPANAMQGGAFVTFADGLEDINAFIIEVTFTGGLTLKATIYGAFGPDGMREVWDFYASIPNSPLESYNLIAYGKLFDSVDFHQDYQPATLPVTGETLVDILIATAASDGLGNFDSPPTSDMSPDGDKLIYAQGQGRKSAVVTYHLQGGQPVNIEITRIDNQDVADNPAGSDYTPLVCGTAPAGTALELYLDGAGGPVLIGTPTAGMNGMFCEDTSDIRPDGLKSIYARAGESLSASVTYELNTAAPGGACGADWPKYRCNMNNTAVSSSTLDIENIIKVWEFDTEAPTNSSPTKFGGKVFIGSTSDYIYTLDSETGGELWRFDTLNDTHTAPAADDDTVYVGSYSATMFALDMETGAEKWRFKYPACAIFSSAVVYNDKVIFGCANVGKVFALNTAENPAERIAWEFDTESPNGTFESVAIVDGVVYFGDVWGYFYAVDADTGVYVWPDPPAQIATNNAWSSPAVAYGKIFAGAWDKKMYAIDKNTGQKLQEFETGGSVYSSPAVADGKVFFGSQDGLVYALNENDFSLAWDNPFDAGGAVRSSPAVADGKVVVGAENGYVYILDAGTGVKLWEYYAGGAVYSSPLISDGKIYIGGNGRLYAFGLPYDTEPPAIVFTSHSDGDIISDMQPVVTAEITDAGSGVNWQQGVSCDPVATCLVQHTATDIAEITFKGPLPEGLNTIAITVSDLATPPNTATASITLDVDTQGPNIENFSIAPDPFSPTNTTSIDIADTTTAGADIFDPHFDAWSLWIINQDGNTVRTFQGTAAPLSQVWDGASGLSVPQPSSPYTCVLGALDTLGNYTEATASVILDDISPGAAITAPVTAQSIFGGSTPPTLINPEIYTVRVQATDNVEISQVEIFLDEVLQGQAAPQGWDTYTFDIDFSTSNDFDQHVISARAVDTAGNNVETSVTVLITPFPIEIRSLIFRNLSRNNADDIAPGERFQVRIRVNMFLSPPQWRLVNADLYQHPVNTGPDLDAQFTIIDQSEFFFIYQYEGTLDSAFDQAGRPLNNIRAVASADGFQTVTLSGIQRVLSEHAPPAPPQIIYPRNGQRISDTTPTVQAAADPGVKVLLYLDNPDPEPDRLIATVDPVPSNGRFRVETVDLGPTGRYVTIYAVADNGSGGTSDSASPQARVTFFLADRQPPAITSLTAVPDPFSPGDPGDGVKDQTLITLAAREDNPARCRIDIYTTDQSGNIGTLLLRNINVPFTGSPDAVMEFEWDGFSRRPVWSDNRDQLQPDGLYFIRVRAFDAFGNRSAMATTTVTIDMSAAPDVTIISPASGTVIGGVQYPVTLTATDILGGEEHPELVERVEITVHNGAGDPVWTTAAWRPDPADHPETWHTVLATHSIGDGPATVRAIAYDSTGNPSAPAEIDVVVDTVAPSPPADLSLVDNEDGTATLSWVPPSTNEDGSPLTDLAGYNVYRVAEVGRCDTVDPADDTPIACSPVAANGIYAINGPALVNNGVTYSDNPFTGENTALWLDSNAAAVGMIPAQAMASLPLDSVYLDINLPVIAYMLELELLPGSGLESGAYRMTVYTQLSEKAVRSWLYKNQLNATILNSDYSIIPRTLMCEYNASINALDIVYTGKTIPGYEHQMIDVINDPGADFTTLDMDPMFRFSAFFAESTDSAFNHSKYSDFIKGEPE